MHRITTAATGGSSDTLAQRLQALVKSDTGHILELHGMQTAIDTSLPKQFIMRAHFNNSPSIQDDDSICILNGREPMSDHQGRSILHQIGQGQLYDPFRLGVECRCRFVKDQKLGRSPIVAAHRPTA
jgi:hypothetical protein